MKKYLSLMIHFFVLTSSYQCLSEELQDLFKELETKLITLTEGLKALQKEETQEGEPQERKKITQDSRYSALNAALAKDVTTMQDNELKQLLDDYNQLLKDIADNKFTVTAMPPNFVAFKQRIENELQKRASQPVKTDIKDDQNYKLLQGALSELQNISSVSSSRLKQLLNAYNELEGDIQKNEFKETVMPPDIADIKQGIETEFEKRKNGKTPPSVTIDTSEMDDTQFENWEYKLSNDIKRYNKLSTVDLPILKDLLVRITAWQKDNRKAEDLGEGFKKFALRLQLEISEREKKIAPKERLKNMAQEIKKYISTYDAATFKEWNKKSEQVTIKEKDVEVPVTVNSWSNNLVKLLNEIYLYFKKAQELTISPETEINKFTKDTVLPDLEVVLNEDNFNQIIDDPMLYEKKVFNDKDALATRKDWIKYLQDYESVSGEVNRAVPENIKNLYQAIIKSVFAIYDGQFKNAQKELQRGGLDKEDELNKMLSQINEYENFLKTIKQPDKLDVDSFKDVLQKKLLERKKSYFYQRIKTAKDFKKYTKKSLEAIFNEIGFYIRLAESMKQPVELDIKEFYKKLDEYLKQIG